MNETRPYVDWKLMNDFMIDVFVKYGVPREDAAICADVLLESDRRGIESHGCNRFKPIYLDRIKNGTLLPRTELEIVKEGPATVVMDAHHGMGMVASHRMMEMVWNGRGDDFQFHPFRYRRLLDRYGGKSGNDRYFGDQCKTVRSSDFWRGTNDGDESADIHNADR